MTDMREALKGLVEKLDTIHKNARYQAVWECAQFSMGPYTGPDYAKELEQARAALAAPGEPVAWPTEPTREMCEAMPVLPALTQDDLRFKALGWPMHAIQNRHRLIAALAVAPASHVDEIERIKKLLEAVRDHSGVATWRNEARELAAAIAKMGGK